MLLLLIVIFVKYGTAITGGFLSTIMLIQRSQKPKLLIIKLRGYWSRLVPYCVCTKSAPTPQKRGAAKCLAGPSGLGKAVYK